MTGCVFSGNAGDLVAGGMLNFGNNSAPTIEDCVFHANTADQGGGMLSGNNATVSVTNCIFDANHGVTEGGGMAGSGATAVTVTGCTFTSNFCTADQDGFIGPGGGIYGASLMTITNCRFHGNRSGQGGGAFVLAHLEFVVNCTFTGNTADTQGGGLIANAGSSAVTNSIFWRNSDAGGIDESAQIHQGGVAITVNDCDVQGGWTGAGANNINADPLFVDADGADNIIGTTDDNARLRTTSPCIDVADFDTYVAAGGPNVDLDGFARDFDDVFTANTGVGVLDYLDMGSYEFNPTAGGPLIEAHPVSVAADAGDPPVQFTVVAPDATAFMWFKDGVEIMDGPDYAGTDGPTLQVTPSVATEGLYTVTASNTDDSQESNPAGLVIRENPCLVDLNGDGVLDFFDVMAFLDDFSAGCP